VRRLWRRLPRHSCGTARRDQEAPDVRPRRARAKGTVFVQRLDSTNICVQRLCREALVWRQLRHANILPFIGLNSRLFPGNSLPALLSPWMPHGSLKDYVASSEYDAERDTYRLVHFIHLETDPSLLTTTVLAFRCPVLLRVSPTFTPSLSRTGTSTTYAVVPGAIHLHVLMFLSTHRSTSLSMLSINPGWPTSDWSDSRIPLRSAISPKLRTGLL
jgi:hypothetical protein